MSMVFGGLCIMLACGGLWLVQVRQQRQLVEAISDLSGSMLEIRGQILANQTPLPRIFLQLSVSRDGRCGAFFQEVVLELQEGTAMQTAWECGIESGNFPKDVAGILQQVGRSFQGDEEQICKVLSLANSCFERVLQKYNDGLPDKRRSCGALCFSGGALLLILLV